MSRLKSIFFQTMKKHRNTYFRFFGTQQPPLNWSTMTEIERMNYAMNEYKPETSEIAYVKALALLKLGNDYKDQAVAALEEAVALSEGKNWLACSKLAEIYNEMGLEHLSFKALKLGNEELYKLIKFGNVEEVIKDIRLHLSHEEQTQPRYGISVNMSHD